MKFKLVVGALIILMSGGISVYYWPDQVSPTPVVRVTPTPTPHPTPSATAIHTAVSLPSISATKKPEPLFCFDTEKRILRESDIDSGCLNSEESLGSGPIEYPIDRPNHLDPVLYIRFLAAQVGAEQAGYSLYLTSGFRSFDRQEDLFEAAVEKYGTEEEASKWVLPPNLSHHPWGTAMDINYPNDPKSDKWLEINGYKYGLCRAYDNEWWHFEGLTDPGKPCPAMQPDASTTKTE